MGADPNGGSEAGCGGAGLQLAGVEVVESGRRILGPVDWRVDAGQRWVLLGPNGAGKSTLLRVAGAWRQPTRGTAEVLCEHLGRVDVRYLRRRIGWVSGELGRLLDVRLTAAEVVATGPANALTRLWKPPLRVEPWVEELLALMGCAGLGDQRFVTLSEGERQRVLLARALAAQPGLLLLDEPFAGLDLGGREQLVDRLAAVASDPTAPPTVLVTHHAEDIPPGFTHAMLLRCGQALAAGPIDGVLVDDAVSACFGVAVTVDRRGGRYATRKA
jgi:iron complex transport system ATP-binding protein